jgi:CRP-like cAMP-binding protein
MNANQAFTNAKFDAGWSLRFSADETAPKAGGRLLTYRARSLIVDEGDTSNAVFEIVEGGVMVFKLLPDGRRQIIEVLGVGDIFGLAPTSVSDVSAEALTPVKVSAFDRRTVDADPALRDRLFNRLRSQICALHDHALLLGRKSAQERIATFIMRLVPNRGGVACAGPTRSNQPVREDCAQVALAMTRQEIADYLGLTIETVSRAFSALKREGIIAYDKQDEVRIGNVCRLCHLTGSH